MNNPSREGRADASTHLTPPDEPLFDADAASEERRSWSADRAIQPVMFVDDSLDILEALAFWLSLAGYPTVTFDNASDALRAMYEGLRPRIIILDLQMPGMDGFAFRAVQLSNREWATIPVVVLTAHSCTDYDRARLGQARFLTKPVNPDILLGVVEGYRVAHDRYAVEIPAGPTSP